MSRLRPAQNKGIQNAMLQVAVAAVVFYVMLVALMYIFQRSFQFYPESRLPSRVESGVASMDEVRFTTNDGLELFAWTQPPSVDGKPWVVIFHGNAGNIAGRARKARVFFEAGYGVMLVEYRGFGGNPGRPTQDGLFADARAALAYLAGQGIAGRQLVLYGESLGTGVAVAMAYEAAQAGSPVAAVLLEAPFSSAADVAAGYYPFLPARLLLKDKFDSLSMVQDIAAPLFIAHGDRDLTVPQTLGRKLYAQAVEPKQALWLEGAAHNDLYEHGLGAAALAFLAGHQI